MNGLAGKKIVIAGGSGFLGLSMARAFSGWGASVTIVSRSKPALTGPWQHQVWDARSLGPWKEALDGTDAVVNLTGRSVNCIKTPDHQDEILRSRVESTHVLGQAMRDVSSPPPVWVQMSTAHWYGDPPSLVCTESSPAGYGFAPRIAKAWEQAFAEARLAEQRAVIMRTSFVIGPDLGAGGGALATLLRLARLGLGGRVGSGKQGMSWIHQADFNRLFARAITDQSYSGVYLVSSPGPLSQVEFMRTLRRVIGMPVGLPAFEWMVRIGAPWIMRTDPELALYGRYLVSERLAEAGFHFDFPSLEEALKDLLGKA